MPVIQPRHHPNEASGVYIEMLKRLCLLIRQLRQSELIADRGYENRQEANKRNKKPGYFLDPIENPFFHGMDLEEEDFPMKEIKNCMNGDGELSVLFEN